MRAEIAVTTPSTILDEMARRQEMIARRAFELFQSHVDFMNAELDDWLTAEREFSTQPDIRFSQTDGRFEIDAALPGVDPKKLEVKVTNEDVIISGERDGAKAEPSSATSTQTAAAAGTMGDGTVRYFASIHLPQPIDPEKVKADYKQGLLHLTAPIVEPKVTTVQVKG